MNVLAATTENSAAVNTVYNVAFGENTSLNELYELLRTYLSEFDEVIRNIVPLFGEERLGDVKHSLASIEKARNLLNYNPVYNIKDGLKEAIKWYYENLSSK
jgi:UDP-N-acetylglucosamine 4-epimerase